MARIDHKQIVSDIVSDIVYLEELGLDGGEIWESIDLNHYSYYATIHHKIQAFEQCGYTVG